MKTLEKELQALKHWDTIENTTFPSFYQGYPKINTCGHGYLAIRKGDMNEKTVIENHLASFVGEHAYYLEEDCDAPKFIDLISK